MKIVRFIPKNTFPKKARIGAILDSIIVDLESAYRSFLIHGDICNANAANRLSSQLLPSDIVEFVENGSISMEAAEQAIRFVKEVNSDIKDEKLLYSHQEVKLLTPIERPVSFRDFLSFEEHIKNSRRNRGQEVPEAWYEMPVYYKGNTSSIIGPEDEVVWPNYTEKLDYELEFGCVIGKNGINIKETDAENHIFGYMVINDFSARDIQLKEMSVGLGPAKGKDFATSMGPCIVTKDELQDPYNLEMTARINGEVWTEGNTSTMYRKFTEIIEYASQSEELVAGDVLGSGTVGLGCGLELGKFLNEGDVVELEVEGLGILRNRIGKRQN